MSLRIGDAERDRIEAEGRAAYPNECCGFLIGRDTGPHTLVEEVLPALNAREDSPRNRYLIPPDAFMRAQRDATARGLDIVGFYHSHPDVEARPSGFDRENAWTGYYYVIVSVRDRAAHELRAWRLRSERDAFEEAAIEAQAGSDGRPSPAESRSP